MPRKRENHSRLFQKHGRFFADFRDFAKWGGSREALRSPGESGATDDASQAFQLVADRLAKLEALRKAHPGRRGRRGGVG
jgi:hypothetical protein